MRTINYIKQLCGIAAKFQCSCFNQLNPESMLRLPRLEFSRKKGGGFACEKISSHVIKCHRLNCQLRTYRGLAPYIWES